MRAEQSWNRLRRPADLHQPLWLRLPIAGLTLGSLYACAAATVPVVGTLVGTGAAVYATQASQQSSAATLAAPPKTVYAGILRLVEQSASLQLLDSDPRRLQLEIGQDEQRLSAQATPLGDTETLLYIWVNGSAPGTTVDQVAVRFLNQLAGELDVAYQRVNQ